MSAQVVFVSVATTGPIATPNCIWECAFIRRQIPSGSYESRMSLLVEHDQAPLADLPDADYFDYTTRFNPERAISRTVAAQKILEIFAAERKPHLVGATPGFDARRLELLLRSHGRTADGVPWHDQHLDVESMAVGWLAARGVKVAFPWTSAEMAAELGVAGTPADTSAMARAVWIRDLFDGMLNG